MVHRLAAAVAAVAIAVTAGQAAAANAPSAANGPAAAGTIAPRCLASGAGSAAWTRLAAHLPPATACPQALRLPRRIAPTLLAQFPHTVTELNGRVYLDLAAVSGQNLTLVASGSPTPVIARCRMTVSPNPGALVLPNPRNGVVLLVCRNQPRP